jgi:alkyl sulfatase BDS1-like metallo-beta-lactamase superfamily hydrolase
MGHVRDLAEKLWTGTVSTDEQHPFYALNELDELAPGVAFISGFANVAALDTDEGLVLVDTGGAMQRELAFDLVRRWSKRPLHTAVYTHGHVDHVFGTAAFDEEARTNRWQRPRVVAHEATPARFDRYKITAGYNGCINARQFRAPGLTWPTDYRYPDVTYGRALSLSVGGVRLELRHARGETDDHTWLWVPDRKVLCTGDLFIWASPNAGNPQKVQRYAGEWATALREMAELGAEILSPGHGVPILGAARVRQALSETAELLEILHDRTLEMMNAGATLDDVLHGVKAPAHLLERPYLRPVYDEPEFVVRNVWRLYGGWWDGNPANLKPAPEATVARELAALAGGADRLAARARELASAGDLPLACHLAELAGRAAPDDPAIRAARSEVYRQRAKSERSLMARGVYAAAANDR